MKYMYYPLIFILFIQCFSNKKIKEKEDKIKIEILLSKHRRYAFIDLYEKSIKQEEKKYNIKKTDSLFDLSSTELYHQYCLKIDFYSSKHPSYTNENYEKMINKWLMKNYFPSMPTDNPNLKTTMTLKKALDFYESSDLNKYIDSLRSIFYEKYRNNNLESLNCMEK